MYTPEYCKNDECGVELDVFLSSRYGKEADCCTPVCAMKALRKKIEAAKDHSAPDSECFTLPNGECITPVCKLHG